MKNRPQHIPRLLAALAVLSLAALACTLPLGEVSLPDDGPPIPVSQGAASSFAEKALASAEGSGRVSFTITQEEATSAVALAARTFALSEDNPALQERGGLPDEIPLDQLAEGLEVTPEIEALLRRFQPPDGEGLNIPVVEIELEEPQVYFKADGRMIVRGYGRIGGNRLPLRVVTRPRAGAGELEFEFVEGQIGRLPLPRLLFNPLGRTLSRALLAGQSFVEISRLEVGAGTLTFTGQVNVENVPLDQ